MNIAQDFLVLIELFIKLVESQAGKHIPAGDEWLNDAQALSRKLFQHLTTIQSISGGTTITIDNDDAAFSFIDHSSAIVITRAALETFLVFNHIYGEENQELSRFNHKLWKLSGLLSRQTYPILVENNKKRVELEKIQIEDLKADIQTNAIFESYSEKQQKQLLKGNWDFDTSWQALGVKAGFHPVHFRMTYNFLCGYSHASYISALQIGQAQTVEAQRDLTSPMLQIGGILMAYFAFAYPKVFKSASEILEANPNAKIVASNWHLTKERMDDVYGH